MFQTKKPRNHASSVAAYLRRWKQSINAIYDGHWRGGAADSESRVVKRGRA
jgi:hypothetical protein